MCYLDIIIVIIAGSFAGVISGTLYYGGYIDKFVRFLRRK